MSQPNLNKTPNQTTKRRRISLNASRSQSRITLIEPLRLDPPPDLSGQAGFRAILDDNFRFAMQELTARGLCQATNW